MADDGRALVGWTSGQSLIWPQVFQIPAACELDLQRFAGELFGTFHVIVIDVQTIRNGKIAKTYPMPNRLSYSEPVAGEARWL